MSLVWVVLLSLQVHAQYAINLKQFRSGDKQNLVGDAKEPDFNEQFFNNGLVNTGFTLRSAKAEAIEKKVLKKLVLPRSLVRSFLEIAEGEAAFSAKRFNNISFQQFRYSEDRSFMEAVIVEHLYHKNGQGQPRERFLNEARDKMDESVGLFNQSLNASRSRVQALIGDGIAGVTEFINEYAKESGRPVLKLAPGAQPKDLIMQIQPVIQNGGAPVVIIEDLEKHSPDFLQKLYLCMQNRILFGNARVILSYSAIAQNTKGERKPPLESLENVFTGFLPLQNHVIIRSVLEYADSVHLVRRPQSVAQYQQIIALRVPYLLHDIAMGGYNGAIDTAAVIEHPAVRSLAEALFAYQEETFDSPMRDLVKRVFNLPKLSEIQRKKARVNPALSCEQLLAGGRPTEVQIEATERLVSAAAAFRDALYDAFK